MATTVPDTEELSRLRHELARERRLDPVDDAARVLTFVRTRGVFSAADLELATDLGRRAAPAIDDNRLYAQAHETTRAKDDVPATSSHELRTPRAAIPGWASALQDDVRDWPLLQEGLATIQRSARIRAQLVDGLLDVSRIAALFEEEPLR